MWRRTTRVESQTKINCTKKGTIVRHTKQKTQRIFGKYHFYMGDQLVLLLLLDAVLQKEGICWPQPLLLHHKSTQVVTEPVRQLFLEPNKPQ